LTEVERQGGYTLIEASGIVQIKGKERVEDRSISPAILPSPGEMVGLFPALLNLRWTSWADAKQWWRGEECIKSKGEAPAPVDRRSLNDVPFALMDALGTRVIGSHWKDWKLLHAATWSTMRITMGFFYAALLAIPLGVLMGSFSKIRALFEPVRLIGMYLPLSAVFSLALLWWGTGESLKVGFLAIASFVVLLPQVVLAIDAVPQELLSSALTLGATRWQQMRFVLLKGAKADIFRALRVTFAVGWTWIYFAEMVNPKQGLGFVIQLGERRAELRPHVYAVILLIVALAFVVNSSWAWVERKLFPFRGAEV
jgi:ABC-type nitrate/sulfonate/bicarbonate transport system permease component